MVAVAWDSEAAVAWDSEAAVAWDSEVAVAWDSEAAVAWDSEAAVVWDSEAAVVWDSEAAVVWDSEAAVVWDSEAAPTMHSDVESPMAVTMAVLITVAADTMGTMLDTDGMAATTVGTADIGGIHTTAGAGVWSGHIGVGDGEMATTVTILGIMFPIPLILIRIIVLRVIHALPMRTTTRHQQTPVRSPSILPQNLGDLKRALLTRMTGVATTPLGPMLRFSQLRGK
jgi:hypothetical protein